MMNQESGSVSDKVSEGIRILSKISEYDERVSDFWNQLSDIDSLVTDFSRVISDKPNMARPQRMFLPMRPRCVKSLQSIRNMSHIRKV